MTDRPPPSYSVAEIVAASICYLARWHSRSALHGHAGVEIPTLQVTERVESFWHRKRCRFCNLDKEPLLEIARRSRHIPPAVLATWNDLSKPARLARISEAQEPPWWDEVTREALTPAAGAT